jgi:hypothetical protein
MAAANGTRACRSGEARHYAIESRAKAAPTVFVCTVKRTLQLTAPAFQLTAMFRSCVAGPLLEARAFSWGVWKALTGALCVVQSL